VALEVKGGTNKESTRGQQIVRRVALTNGCYQWTANWCAGAMHRGAHVLEQEDLLES
jgi:hypothetical protein